MELPKTKSKPIEENPKFLILFGKPKCGKSTITAALPNALHIDLENGTDYLECAAVKVNTVDDLRELRRKLFEANYENKGPVYTYGVLDTATKLEDLILPIAANLYAQTPMGKGFTGDVRTLPQGAGL